MSIAPHSNEGPAYVHHIYICFITSDKKVFCLDGIAKFGEFLIKYCNKEIRSWRETLGAMLLEISTLVLAIFFYLKKYLLEKHQTYIIKIIFNVHFYWFS